MFCMNCGKELPNGAKFCDGCGTKVGETKTVNSSNDLSTQISKIKCLTEYDLNTPIDNIATVKFGKYPQSDVDGKKFEDIDWIVLEKQNGKALLLSKFVIDANYDNKMSYNYNWGNQPVREYINNNFAIKAFSRFELDNIIETNIKQGYVPEDNEYSDFDYSKWDSETDTKDKLFFLSRAEIEKYFNCEKVEEAYSKIHNGELLVGCDEGCIWETLRAKATDYVINKKFSEHKNKFYAWQTRSIGDSGRQVISVDEYGWVHCDNGHIANGIRPAMWVKI